MIKKLQHINHFHVLGVNYRKSDTSVRGRYAVNQEDNVALLELSQQFEIKEIFIVSTCNRTEIYAVCDDPNLLGKLLCNYTKNNFEEFVQYAYYKNGYEALKHLQEVACGLDSQILGDYEIISQIKQSFLLAKNHQRVGALLEKIYLSAIHTARLIRSNTQLSSGSVSVAYTAVQFIKQSTQVEKTLRILIVGTGKIGKNACKNIIQEIPNCELILVNRTIEKAAELATELDVTYNSYANLNYEVDLADVVLVATNAPQPTITTSHLQNKQKHCLVIDVSIPNNVSADVVQNKNIQLVNVDQLSKEADHTLQRRQEEIPKAKAIIESQILEFEEWYQMRLNVPMIKVAKLKLSDLQNHSIYMQYYGKKNDDTIQKVLNNMATQMKEKNQGACNFILAINDFITR
jgi:glutamyl-tRNA reductase